MLWFEQKGSPWHTWFRESGWDHWLPTATSNCLNTSQGGTTPRVFSVTSALPLFICMRLNVGRERRGSWSLFWAQGNQPMAPRLGGLVQDMGDSRHCFLTYEKLESTKWLQALYWVIQLVLLLTVCVRVCVCGIVISPMRKWRLRSSDYSVVELSQRPNSTQFQILTPFHTTALSLGSWSLPSSDDLGLFHVTLKITQDYLSPRVPRNNPALKWAGVTGVGWSVGLLRLWVTVSCSLLSFHLDHPHCPYLSFSHGGGVARLHGDWLFGSQWGCPASSGWCSKQRSPSCRCFHASPYPHLSACTATLLLLAILLKWSL